MNNLPDNPAPSAPVRLPFWQQLLRFIVTASLALALTVIAAIFVAGYMPALLLSQENETLNMAVKTIAILAVLFVVFLPLGLVVVLGRKRWLTWKVLAFGWLAVLPMLGWLARDEPAIRHPLPIEEFSPAFSGAEKSFAVLMRYSKQAPSDEARAFDKVKMTALWDGSANTREPAKWIEFVTKHRAELEADWASLAPQRRWLEELAAFDRIGDLSPADPNANIMAFQVWRTLSQRTCAMATLQALDGHGDEAMAMLLPMLDAGRKLQPSSRYLVRNMIAVVVERMCTETAGIILDRTPVSAASRARLDAVLASGNAAAQARRLILVEYAQIAPTIGSLKLGDWYAAMHDGGGVMRRPLNFLSGLLINPNATINLYGNFVYELADLAEAREQGKLAVRSTGFFNTVSNAPGMKNVGGRYVVVMAVPVYEKIIENFWKVADLRADLRKRLAAPADGK